jgi:hypothetical protein
VVAHWITYRRRLQASLYLRLPTYLDSPLPDRRTLLRVRTEGACPQPVPGENSAYTVIVQIGEDGEWLNTIAGWVGYLRDVPSENWFWDGIVPWTAVTTAFITTTGSSQSWSVPSDWNSSSNTVEGIGCGGSGTVPVSPNFGGGGGGGAYAKASNVSLTQGGSTTYDLGSAGNNVDTMFKSTSDLVAKAGVTATTTTGGAGGASASCVPTTGAFSGGAGGNGGTSTAGGGGGAAGPDGAGKNGGTNASGWNGGGGGGGSDGGSSSAGGNSNSDTVTGGAGGNGNSGSGGGTPGGPGSAGSDATASTGGGGGGGGVAGLGGNGATGKASWTQTSNSATAGAGGGGGGAGASSSPNDSSHGQGGLYGGGGGGAQNGTVGAGAQGIIVATYTPGAGSTFMPFRQQAQMLPIMAQ